MKCTYCKSELEKFRKSAPIPNLSDDKYEVCYIICSCGNVMIGSFKDGVLNGVQATPSNDTPETRRMMAQAAELFKMSGTAFYTQKVSENSPIEPIQQNNHDQEIIDSEEVAPNEEEHSCNNCTNCTCGHEHKEPEFKKQNVFKKLLNNILKLFKK